MQVQTAYQQSYLLHPLPREKRGQQRENAKRGSFHPYLSERALQIKRSKHPVSPNFIQHCFILKLVSSSQSSDLPISHGCILQGYQKQLLGCTGPVAHFLGLLMPQNALCNSKASWDATMLCSAIGKSSASPTLKNVIEPAYCKIGLIISNLI